MFLRPTNEKLIEKYKKIIEDITSDDFCKNDLPHWVNNFFKNRRIYFLKNYFPNY